MIQLGIRERKRQDEEISQLEHEVVEGTDRLKQSLAAHSKLSEKIYREMVDKELAQQEAIDVGRRLGEARAEMDKVATENAKLKRMVEERDEKLSSSATELATLQAAKDEVEPEFDRNFEETEELLKQSFLRVVRQAHVLYGESPTSHAFDLDYKVYQGQLMSSAKASALAAQEARPTEGEEGEGREDNQE